MQTHSRFVLKEYKNEEEVKQKIEVALNQKTGKLGGKYIYQYDDSWNFIKKYRSCAEAARELGNPKSFSNIARSARSNGEKKALGSRWTYEQKNKEVESDHE